MEKDKELAEFIMYNEWPQGLPTLADAPWNKRSERQYEGLRVVRW
jgi:hypothetical protein